jgi:hypothetical protein
VEITVFCLGFVHHASSITKKNKDKAWPSVSMTKKCMLYKDTAHLNSDIHEMSYLYLFYIYTGK